MPLLQAAGGIIDYEEWGNGADCAILLHAAAAGPRSLSKLGKLLADSGLRAIAPAFNGYGGTNFPPAGAGPLETNQRMVFALAQALPARRRLLFGHSMGGLIALKAAAAGFPADAIAVYEPVAFGVLDESNPRHEQALDWDRGVTGELVARVAAGEPERGLARFVEAWNERDWAQLPEKTRNALAAMAGRIAEDAAVVCADKTPLAAYAPINPPALVFRSEARSPEAVRLAAGAIAAALPNSRLCDIADAGHFGPQSAPEFIAGELIRFWGGIS